MPKRSPPTAEHTDVTADHGTLVDTLLARITEIKWGITAEQRTKLINKMVNDATSDKNIADTRIRAFNAIVAAQGLDLAAVKLLIEKMGVEALMQQSRRGNLLSVEILRDVPVEQRVSALDQLRKQRKSAVERNPNGLSATG